MRNSWWTLIFENVKHMFKIFSKLDWCPTTCGDLCFSLVAIIQINRINKFRIFWNFLWILFTNFTNRQERSEMTNCFAIIGLGRFGGAAYAKLWWSCQEFWHWSSETCQCLWYLQDRSGKQDVVTVPFFFMRGCRKFLITMVAIVRYSGVL